MPKISFIGAGSTMFAKNVLGDSMLADTLSDSHIALYDIDAQRLDESRRMLETLNKNINRKRATITTHLGVRQRKAALRGADFVVNAIQVGGYEPSTVIDFEIPKRYGLRQTIADTLGVGGIFRALRTIPVMLEFGHEMEKLCPDAWLLNYTNPMSMLTGAMLQGTEVKTVGLCHSVQVCAQGLLQELGLLETHPMAEVTHKIAGINHMAWLLEIKHKGKDLYPAIKRAAARVLREHRGKKHHKDLVRLDCMMQFGHYITESSEHNAEYMPYWIKSRYPELIDQYHIPLDDYPRRCVRNLENRKAMIKEIVGNPKVTHKRTHEYGSYIMDAIVSGKPVQIGGNVLNHGLIPNLPSKAVVEVPCLIDKNGVQGCYVGDLPEPCAALNRTNINVHLLTIEAALQRRKDRVYQAAMLDPHTAAELSLDDIRKLCDDLIEAHGRFLPTYH